MKLLFVFTGGTIGSTLGEQYIATDRNKPYKLLECYRQKYGIDFDYDIKEPYCSLSENNTGETLSALMKAVVEQLDKRYDGIVVTHGTDTLQYSAAALGYACGNNCMPVVLVSANHPIEHPFSNGLDHLRAAICWIAEKRGRGVFVAYRNPGERTKIHRATRLNISLAYSDSNESVQKLHVGEYDSEWNYYPNELFSEQLDDLLPFGAVLLSEQAESILRIEPYPGMVYSAITERTQYVLHGSYHSGTVNTAAPSAQKFFKEAKEKGIPVFLSGITKGISYDSTSLYRQLNLIPLYGLAPIAAFMKLWMTVSLGKNPMDLIGRSLGGDLF